MNAIVDLFGQEVSLDSFPRLSPGEEPKRKTKANGYAARPGSGPAGETCRTCGFAWRKHFGRRDYWKCGKAGNCSNCISSDIRLKSPSCQFWKPRQAAANDGG